MKLPLKTLEKFISIDYTPQKLAEILTMIGLEAEGIEELKPSFEKVIVAKVLDVSPHPEASKLGIAQVFDGNNEYQVVCGDPSCKAGMLVAFAQHGAKLTDENGKIIKIKKGKLRGVESLGMLCSEKELQLSDDDSGITNLPQDYPLGTELANYYKDTILEIGLTPNLNFCSSAMGVARELATVEGKTFSLPKHKINENSDCKIEDKIQVQINASHDCPRYTCRLINNVTVAPSPLWLQQEIVAMGFRPVNNIVDITNYVLLELGHPLHAFDYDALNTKKLEISSSFPNEKFETLDHIHRSLPENTLMIRDGKQALAIGGIMGGAESEVSDKTTSILLECAYFAPSSIRKSSKLLNLSSESSKRFERGTDPNFLSIALDRAAFLIQEIAGGSIAQGIIDVGTQKFPEKTTSCRLNRINQILGLQLSLNEVEEIFKRLHFSVKTDTDTQLNVTVPTFRVDISSEIDLIEEVARIYGYQNIPRTHTPYKTGALSHSPLYIFENKLREKALSEGLQELISCDLISPTQAKQLTSKDIPINAFIHVLNPTSIDQSVMRPSLLPSLLQVAKINQDQQEQNLYAFEIGNTHSRKETLICEKSVCSFILFGNRREQHWEEKAEALDFYDLKGVLENIFKGIQIEKLTYHKTQLSHYHPGRQASILHEQDEIGTLGEVHPSLARQYGLKGRIYFAELSLNTMLTHVEPLPQMKPLSTFPSSSRDWTLSLKADAHIGSILTTLQETPSKLLERVYVKDIYRSETLGNGKQNVTFHLCYRDKKKTIAYESVEKEHKRLTEKVLSEFSDQLV